MTAWCDPFLLDDGFDAVPASTSSAVSAQRRTALRVLAHEQRPVIFFVSLYSQRLGDREMWPR